MRPPSNLALPLSLPLPPARYRGLSDFDLLLEALSASCYLAHTHLLLRQVLKSSVLCPSSSLVCAALSVVLLHTSFCLACQGCQPVGPGVSGFWTCSTWACGSQLFSFGLRLSLVLPLSGERWSWTSSRLSDVCRLQLVFGMQSHTPFLCPLCQVSWSLFFLQEVCSSHCSVEHLPCATYQVLLNVFPVPPLSASLDLLTPEALAALASLSAVLLHEHLPSSARYLDSCSTALSLDVCATIVLAPAAAAAAAAAVVVVVVAVAVGGVVVVAVAAAAAAPILLCPVPGHNATEPGGYQARRRRVAGWWASARQ